jgi:hypothetical protein
VDDGRFSQTSLSGINFMRMDYEAQLLAARVGESIVGERIAGMPELERVAVIGRLSESHVRPGTEGEFINVIREHLPQERNYSGI